VALVRPHLRSERLQNLPGIGGPLIHNLTWRHGRHDGDRGDTLRDTANDRQRLPPGVLLILGKAVRELAGMAKRRTIDAAGAHVEQIDQREA
jgi:hypothetical protein